MACLVAGSCRESGAGPDRAAPWGPSAPGEASSDRRHLGPWKVRPFARRTGSGPQIRSFSAVGSPEPRASGRVTRGARQAVESASAPQRARWLVAFRPVRRRPNPAPNRSESSGAVPLAASAFTGSRQAESVEKASSARGIVVRLVCPCSVEWLQKSAGGAGPRKPLSVVAESGGKDLARSGEPATGERAPRPGSRPSWQRDQRRARKGSPPMEGVVDRESRRPSTGRRWKRSRSNGRSSMRFKTAWAMSGR